MSSRLDRMNELQDKSDLSYRKKEKEGTEREWGGGGGASQVGDNSDSHL